MATCANCNENIPWGETKTRIDIQTWRKFLCPACARLGGYMVGGSYNDSLELYRINVHLKKSYEEFSCRKGVKKYCNDRLMIDEATHTFGVGAPIFDNPNQYNFKTASLDNILELQVFDDYNTIQVQTKAATSGAGKALVGGVLFGPLGAVVGGLSGRSAAEHNQIQCITKLGFTVIYETGESVSFNLLVLLFDYSSLPSNDPLIPQVKAALSAICEVLHPYTKHAKESTNAAQSEEASATTQQLLDASALLEKGLLTQAEFEAFKRKLLS